MEITKNTLTDAFKLHKEGNLFDAEMMYLDFLKENPESSDALNYLGLLKLQQNSLEEAEYYINKALSLKDNPYYFECLGQVYVAKKYYDVAAKTFYKALQLDDSNYALWFDYALMLKQIGDYENSKMAYQKVLELNPRMSGAYYNLASLNFNESEPFKALENYKKVVEICPDDVEAKYFLGLAYMQTKDYKNGLRYFENRLCRKSAIMSQEKTYPNICKKAPIWQGEDIKDKVLYTYYEAGFGDMIMFARYLPELCKRCKKVILKPQEQMYELFRDNFPDVEVLRYFKPEADMDFDVHLPYLSLPYALGLEGDDVFKPTAKYLSANPEIAKKYKEKYFNTDKFKIAIKWQGSTYYEKNRVITIESFFKLFSLDWAQFYSAQTFEGSEELKKAEKFNLIDIGQTFGSFADTAGALENVDLVICNDTSLAHLAAAMGKPCWIVLPHVYNWRWHTDLSKCDWYDSVKIFRQKVQGDWTEVFERIYNELSAVAKKKY